MAGHPVCREAFAYLVGIGKHRLTRCRHSFQGTDMRTVAGQGGFFDETTYGNFSNWFMVSICFYSSLDARHFLQWLAWTDPVFGDPMPSPITTQDLLRRLLWNQPAWHLSWFICTGVLLSLCQQRPLDKDWGCLGYQQTSTNWFWIIWDFNMVKLPNSTPGLLQRITWPKGVKNCVKNSWSDWSTVV